MAKSNVAATPSPTTGSKKPIQLLTRLEVIDRVKLTYPTILNWMRVGKFPRSRAVGGRVAWVESEIDDWITNLPVAYVKTDEDDAAA